MKVVLKIIILLFLILQDTIGQNIRKIDELNYGGPNFGGRTKRDYKRKVKKAKRYAEHFDLYFHSHKIFEYDQQGNLINETKINENRQIEYKKKITYIDSILISRIDEIYPLNYNRNHSLILKYNDKKSIIQSIDSSINFLKIVKVSYPTSFLIESITMVNGELMDKWITHIDSTGMRKRIIAYDMNGSIFFINEEVYNEKEQLIKQISYDLKNQPILTRTYEYDKYGNSIYKKIIEHIKGRVDESYRITDSLTHTVDLKMFTNGEIHHWSRTHYDLFNNDTLTEFFDNKDILDFKSTNEYKYDEFGCWIEKKEFMHGKLQSIIYREIDYY